MDQDDYLHRRHRLEHGHSLPTAHMNQHSADVNRMTSNVSSSSTWSFDLLPQTASHASSPPERTLTDRQEAPPPSIFGSGGGTASVFATSPIAASSSHGRTVSEQPELPPLQTAMIKEQQYDGRGHDAVDTHMIPRVEKEVDDVTVPPSSRRRARAESPTLTTLSRLFAVQDTTSPDLSRASSYTTRYPSVYNRSMHSVQTAALPEHLYSRGLLSGRHSDITVHAFGQQYKLHRLILDQAPFFASALSEPWLEANAKDMTVHPEDIDTSITQTSFELALKRLYGCRNLVEEDRDPVGLFATGCWLEMHDLVESAIDSMLRQMTPETLSPLIKLVTSNYYGRAGDKILASAKSMLCRDGHAMPLKFWDGIPGDIVREIVGGDGFFIDGEFDRWILAKQILNRKLRQQAAAAGLVQSGSTKKVLKVPETTRLMAVRFDGVYRKSNTGSGYGIPDSLQKWISLYTHPDIEPILVLLDEGIHYIHLDFEQLQCIRQAKDCLGLPVMSEQAISDALWQQMELRQKVVNAREAELELGLSVQCTEDSASYAARDTTMSIHASSEPQRPKGKRRETDEVDSMDDIDSGSWDANGKPRKFWIPSSDCNIVMGGTAEPIIATSNNTTLQRHASRLSATIRPEDVQWAADFTAVTSQPRPPVPTDTSQGAAEPLTFSYTQFPPMRFAAEFPNPRMLKEKRRVYSRTVFYAGSLWNIYIQKVASSRSKQLGVYLHRAKERETEEVIAGTTGLASGTVDDRIGQIEREFILRGEGRERRQQHQTTAGPDDLDGDDFESSDNAGIEDGPISRATAARSSTMRDLLGRRNRASNQVDALGISHTTAASTARPSNDVDSDATDSADDDLPAYTSRQQYVPTVPPYVDARPTIKTYFKIYSPSRGGRMLSVYESAPDKFNFSQSWGWKSSGLLGSGLLGEDEDDAVSGAEREDASGKRTAVKDRGDGKLRFMVVIGNI